MSEHKAVLTGREVWRWLMAGNRRFCENRPEKRDWAAIRQALASGQQPKAAILACADSRVSPEVVFDQGLGEVFVVRTAGLTLDAVTLGSLEYAVAHLKVPLLVVKGHESCGAIQAAWHHPKLEEGHLTAVVKQIAPAVTAIRQEGDEGPEVMEKVNDLHLKNIFAYLREQSAIIREAVAAGRLAMVLCKYSLRKGEVVFHEATF